MADKQGDRAARSLAPKTSTDAIVARNAPTAVVLRRGPTRMVRLLRWDLRNDRFVAGQWLIGKVVVGASGLSPNGELLVYAARKGPKTFTAVCRPPYFTALAYWENSWPWPGGGFFADDRRLVLGCVADRPSDMPPALEITDVWTYFSFGEQGGFGDRVRRAPEARHGWQAASGHVDRKWSPVDPNVTLERTSSAKERSYSLVHENHSHDLGTLDWADWALDGTLIFGRRGCLYRQHVSPTLSTPPVLAADLDGQAFESIIAPAEARHWPTQLGKKKRGRRSG